MLNSRYEHQGTYATAAIGWSTHLLLLGSKCEFGVYGRAIMAASNMGPMAARNSNQVGALGTRLEL